VTVARKAPSNDTPKSSVLTWGFNPWRRTPLRSVCALIVNLLIVALVYFGDTAEAYAPLAFLLLFGMTLTLFVPVTYRLDENGVTVFFLGTRSFRPWNHYKNFYPHKEGVFLTSMPKPSPLDPFRGHFLRFSENRDEVLAYLKSHIIRTNASMDTQKNAKQT